MSQHGSFGSGSKSGSLRTVLKRYERLEALTKKGLWKKEQGVLALPKVKILKIKAKKQKAAATDAAAPAAGAAASAGKPAAAAKPAVKTAAKPAAASAAKK